ncbi:MAG TPA: ankyrin repeat domain-containing protein [Candidatus Babeliales bacterium]|jgi:ankyrin repeat protein|nr:ankyrin repeat domain-containing protein [Candidatus Babeliales bacterium]
MIKNKLFITFLILIFASNTHTMKRIRENQPSQSFPFTNLPPEMRYQVMLLLGAGSTAQTVEEAGKAINAFAQTSKELHALINDPKICLTIIKNLSQQFECSDEEAAEALQTKEAERRLLIQKQFLNVCKAGKFNEKLFNILYEDYKKYVDLNFTFHDMYNYFIEDETDFTLLMLAAEDQDCLFITTVLNYGADINKTNPNGTTAYMIALRKGALKTIKCFVRNFPIVVNQQDNTGFTALMLAAKDDDCSFIHILFNRKANVNAADTEGTTALMMAVENGREHAIKCLLKHPHIAINQQDKKGYTVLLYAFNIFRNSKKKLIIKFLLDAGANPEIANHNGDTPLQAAKQTGDQEIIDLIQDAIDKKHGKK